MIQILLVSIILTIIFTLFGDFLNRRYFSIKYISSTCLGLLVFFGIFEIFFFLGYLIKLPNMYNHILLIVLLSIMLFISCKDLYEMKFDKKYLLYGGCALLMVAILSVFYFYNDHYLNTADVNHYVNIIKDGIGGRNIRPDFGPMYTYQSYYQFFSSFIFLLKKIFNFELASKINVWSIFNILSFFIFIETWVISLVHIILKKTKKIGRFISYSFATLIFVLTPWVLVTASHGNTYRVLAIFAIIVTMAEYFKKRSINLICLLVLLIISLIAFTSSGLFLGGVLLYAFVMYGLYNKNRKIILDTLIISIPLALFATAFYKILIIILPILYSIIILFSRSKLFQRVESILFQKKSLLFVLPIIFFLFSFTINDISMISFFRQPYQDIVPDLFNFKFNREIIKPVFNIIYFSVIGVIIFLTRNNKENDFVRYLLIITLLTFLNPFVFPFVYKYLTNEVYFRLTELIYNPLVLICLLDYVYLNASKTSIILMNIIILLLNFMNIQINKNIFKLDFKLNPLYHMEEQKISTIQKFDSYIYQSGIVPEDTVVISQIPSLTLLSDNKYKELMDFEFYRIMSDKPNFTESSFHNLFAPFEDSNPKDQYNYNYTYACTYAIYKDANFIIVDQEKYKSLIDGLWPCVETIDTFDNYVVFKVRTDLWEKNIIQGYTGDYSDEISMYTSEKLK